MSKESQQPGLMDAQTQELIDNFKARYEINRYVMSGGSQYDAAITNLARRVQELEKLVDRLRESNPSIE